MIVYKLYVVSKFILSEYDKYELYNINNIDSQTLNINLKCQKNHKYII